MLYFREEGYAKMVENMRQLCHDVRCDFDKWFSSAPSTSRTPRARTPAPHGRPRLYSSRRWAASTTRTAPGFRSTDLWATTRTACPGQGQRRVHLLRVRRRLPLGQVPARRPRHRHLGLRPPRLHQPRALRLRRARLPFRPVRGPAGPVRQPAAQRQAHPHVQSARAPWSPSRSSWTRSAPTPPLHADLRSSNQAIDFDIEAVKEKSQNNPCTTCSTRMRASAHPAQGRRRHAGAGRRDGHGRRCRSGHRRERRLRAADRSHRARAVPQDLRARGPHRQLRPRPRPVPPHALLRARRRLPQLLPGMPGAPSEGRPDAELSRARLAACDAVRNVLALTLSLIGVSAPEQM